MRRVGHRPASQTRCRSAADAAVAPPAVTPNRTIATRREAVVRQTQAQPPRSLLRPTKTNGPNTHSVRGTATAQPTAGSFPAGFRTPAPLPVASSVTAGIRNPQQTATSLDVHAARGRGAQVRGSAGGAGANQIPNPPMTGRPIARNSFLVGTTCGLNVGEKTTASLAGIAATIGRCPLLSTETAGELRRSPLACHYQ